MCQLARALAIEVMPASCAALELMDDTIDRIDLGFQQELRDAENSHTHADVSIAGLSGSWGTYCTMVLDREGQRLCVWSSRRFEIDCRALETRIGRAQLAVVLDHVLASATQHRTAIETEFEVLERVGYCRHDGILTVAHLLHRRMNPWVPEKQGREGERLARLFRALGIGPRKA